MIEPWPPGGGAAWEVWMGGPPLGAWDDRETPDAEALLAGAWPDGVPAEERAVLGGLPPDRRERVLRRLAAMLATDRTMAEREAMAGDTRTAFFRARRRWDATRSLRSLASYVDHAPRGRDDYPDAEREAVRQIGLRPDATREGLAAAVRDALASPPGMSTLRRIVGDALRRCAVAEEGLAERFGRTYAIEYVTTDVPLATAAGAEWADAAILFETSTGLVLGHAIGSNSDAAGIVRVAAATAAEGATGVSPADRPDGPSAGLVVRLPPPGAGSPNEAATLYRQLARAIGEEALLRDRVDFGGLMSGPVGFRLGGVRLEPRRTADLSSRSIPDVDGGSRPLLDGTAAAHRLARAIDRHNAPLVARLGALGLVAPGAATGRFAELLRWARRPPER